MTAVLAALGGFVVKVGSSLDDTSAVANGAKTSDSSESICEALKVCLGEMTKALTTCDGKLCTADAKLGMCFLESSSVAMDDE